MAVYGGIPSGPRVTEAYIGALPSGSGLVWNNTFLNYLTSDYGYSIPVGRINLATVDISSRGQLNPLPWINLNCVTLGFNQDVNISSNSLSISGVARTYTITNFIYYGLINSTYYASWYFDQSSRPAPERINQDKIRITLSANNVKNIIFDTPLAGDFTNATWTTTGDATTSAGQSLPSRGSNNTNFSLRLNILPGDVTGDRSVLPGDRTTVRSRRELTVSSGNYSAFVDVTGDGIIRSGIDTSGVPILEDDVNFVEIYLGTSFPTGVI